MECNTLTNSAKFAVLTLSAFSSSCSGSSAGAANAKLPNNRQRPTSPPGDSRQAELVRWDLESRPSGHTFHDTVERVFLLVILVVFLLIVLVVFVVLVVVELVVLVLVLVFIILVF